MVPSEVLATKEIPNGKKPFQPKITIFHCVNAITNPYGSDNVNCEVKTIKMPCSSMTRDVFLLRAFEAGADAVIVVVCPEGTCRHLEGNTRAVKRVEE
jgi:F420-non-reducing hydrogenase iron-sulfur subunit